MFGILLICIGRIFGSTESIFSTLRHLTSLLNPSQPVNSDPSTGCSRFALLQQLRTIVAKPSMESFTTERSSGVVDGSQSAIAVSHAIYESAENEGMRTECPLGVATSEIYLAVAQEKDWKYKLLHKGLYALLNFPVVSGSVDSWPVNVQLVDTLFRNSESSIKPQVKLTGSVSDKSVLFYNWYLTSQCECTSRSWCHPFFLHKHKQQIVSDIFLVHRDAAKTIYRMDSRGCFRSIGYGLSDVFLNHEFDKVFVFEVNAFMHPEMRALKRKSEILFPMYAFSQQQISALQNSTLLVEDHTYLKPPASVLTRTLTVEYRKATQRHRRLVIPAAVWSPKQQVELLKKIGNHLDRLNLNLVFLGQCTPSPQGGQGSLSYCHEFDRLVAKHGKRVQWLENVSDPELGNFYAESLGILLFSANDCNPRVLYEALWTDTPFLVSTGVVVPEAIRQFGRIFPEEELVQAVEVFIAEATSRRGWKVGELRAFAEEFVNEDVVYSEVFQRAGLFALPGSSTTHEDL